MEPITLAQAKKLAHAQGYLFGFERELANMDPNHQGEVFCVFPEGTKVCRRKNEKTHRWSWYLYGYNDRDVPATIERLKTLPRAPRPNERHQYRVLVSSPERLKKDPDDYDPHWVCGSWVNAWEEVRRLRKEAGRKVPVRVRRVK